MRDTPRVDEPCDSSANRAERPEFLAVALACGALFITALCVLTFWFPLDVLLQLGLLAGLAGGLAGWSLALWRLRSRGRPRVSTRARWRKLAEYPADDEWLRQLPGSVVAIALVSLCISSAALAAGIAEIPSGSPEQLGAKYYMNEHGAVKQITKSEYESAVGAEQRLLGWIGTALLSSAAVVASARRRRISLE